MPNPKFRIHRAVTQRCLNEQTVSAMPSAPKSPMLQFMREMTAGTVVANFRDSVSLSVWFLRISREILMQPM